MPMSQRDVLGFVSREMMPAFVKERDRLDRVDKWYRWDHDSPHQPRHSTREYKELSGRAQTPWLGLVVTSVAQSLYVEGYRSADGVDDASPWQWWQVNGMDRRQIAVHRAALAYGLSYVSVLPGEDDFEAAKPAMRGHSPRRMIAFYDEPEHDDWPHFALQAEPATINGSTGWALRLYDDESVYFLQADASGTGITWVESRLHGLGVCPVVRFANLLDLEGRADGEVEPFIPVAGRIDQTVFDRLVVQRFSSWVVRTIAGMSKPEEGEDAAAARLRLRVEDLLVAEDADTRFGSLPATPLEGFISAAEADIRTLAAVSQTPAHELLGQMANLSAEALAAARASLTAKVEERKHTFGECVIPETRVILADGTKRKIHDIVMNRDPVEVLSVNDDGQLVARRVVNWHRNPRRGRRLYAMSFRSAGVWRRVTASEDHQVLLDRGWVRLDEVVSGQDRVATGEPAPNSRQRQIILGSLLGDGSTNVRRPHAARFTMAHTTAQREWLQIKVDALQSLDMQQIRVNHRGPSRSHFPRDAYRSSTRDLGALVEFHAAFYVDRHKVVPELALRELDVFGLAVWFCDDGTLKVRRRGGRPWASLAVCGFEFDEAEALAEMLRTRFGLACKAEKESDRYPRIRFSADGTAALGNLIGAFVPESMRYKLPSDAPAFDVALWEMAPPDVYYDIVEVVDAALTIDERRQWLYDIEVEGTHNYVTNGGVVHNSWEQVLRLSGWVMGDKDAARDFSAQVRWKDTEIRSLAQAADALGKLATMLGVPVEVLWEKIPGWTQQDVERAKVLAAQGGGIDALMAQLLAGQSSPSPMPASPMPAPMPSRNGA